MGERNWRFAGVFLLVLADGALALAYRYRGERSEGPGLLRATTIFAGFVAILVLALATNQRVKGPWVAVGVLAFTATATALLFAWASNPCRYQGCVRIFRDNGFSYWAATAASIATAALWSFLIASRRERRGRWGMRIAGLAFAIVVVASGAMFVTAPRVTGPFFCGQPLPYDAPTPSPDPNNQC